MTFPIYGKNVPNHQPDYLLPIIHTVILMVFTNKYTLYMLSTTVISRTNQISVHPQTWRRCHQEYGGPTKPAGSKQLKYLLVLKVEN